MFLPKSSPNSVEQRESLIIKTLFVLAQLERTKQTATASQVADAVVKTLMPPNELERMAAKRAVLDIIVNKELVKLGLMTYARPRREDAPLSVAITQRGLASLSWGLIDLIDFDVVREVEVTPGAAPNLEEKLRLQMLGPLIKLFKKSGTPVRMDEWRPATKSILVISEDDMKKLSYPRTDAVVDQRIRNVGVHNSMVKAGWAHKVGTDHIPSEKGMAVYAQDFLEWMPYPKFDAPAEKAQNKAEEPLVPAPSRPRMRHG